MKARTYLIILIVAALAAAAENHSVLADNVAGTDGEQGDLLLAALADDAFAAVDTDLIEVAAKRVRN